MIDLDLQALLSSASREQRRSMRFAILYAIMAVVSAVALLGLSGWFITCAALAGIAGIAAVQAFNYLLPSAAIRLLAIVRTLSRYGERVQGHKAALQTLATIRADIFQRFVEAPDMGRVSGDMAAALLQDVEALEDRFIRMPGTLGAFAGAGAALLLCAAAGWAAAMAVFAIVIMTLGTSYLLAGRLLPAPARRIQDAIARLKQDVVEYAACSAEIVAYILGESVEDDLHRRAAEMDRARLAFARGEALLAAIVTLMGGIAMAAVIALSTAPLPVTLLAGLAAAGAIEASGAAVRSIGRDATVAAGFHRLSSLVARTHQPPLARLPLQGMRITIGTGADAIEMRSGARLAVTGLSGSGKTTLLTLLAGLHDNSGVAVTIDGRPMADCPAPDRRSLFALSPQDAQVIAGTIADNLRLARSRLSDAALWDALGLACLADEVRAMPQGLMTWIGDSGAQLSGGQRKRLSLARALLAGRPWLLLDEPSEGLDVATEQQLKGNLAAWLDRTQSGLIVVTHRPAMLALADRRLTIAT
ncbi:MAG: ATP-binding cassette domain-containing protein [Candidatus Andeanibacterium colombiense]|uniref:ATP-binding cassette domain-containing protein n=1 Tax=Candidatus Andeanibacterium colombiense TaxID=3121345 RepID=A0AAJ6BNY1_9SPHN|nr:MAG: ATP-binding cassette domain-containing protein [Sphingomonadaceae bacterium]